MSQYSLFTLLSSAFYQEPDTVYPEMKGNGMMESAKPKEQKTVKQWNFLTSHALVLLFIARHHRITAREISLEVGITERAVRTIIVDLEEAGYLQRSREGRTAKYDVNHGMPMRHATQKDVAVGDFLETLRASLSSAGKPSEA